MATVALQAAEVGGFSYLLALPSERRGGATRRPVLCFLHGNDEAAPAPLLEGLTRHGPLHPGAPELVRHEFIVVAPQLPRAGDIWHRYDTAVLEILRSLVRDHAADERRVHLTGFSYGGNGVFDLAEEHPAMWAALWAVDPTRPPRARLDLPVWVSIGEAARAQTPQLVERLALEEANETLDDIALARRDRLYADRGFDHVASAVDAYADARVYRWLLARQRR